jgi:hypothetical protein
MRASASQGAGIMGLIRRWALNRGDLALMLAAVALVSAAAAMPIVSRSARVWLLGKPDLDQGVASALLAAWVAIVLAGLGAAVKVTVTRQNLTSLFTSEVRALQYGLSTMEMFTFWGAVFKAPEAGGFGFADVPRDEDYFQTFHSVSDNIGNLEPRTVEALVRFYTYLKMSRDAAGALHSWRQQTEPGLRRMHVAYVLQLLALSMLWGFVALHTMGAPCLESDRSFRGKIRDVYEATFGVGAFARVFEAHPRHRQLSEFFGVGSPAAAPAAPAASITP